jgi:hypothetical protein
MGVLNKSDIKAPVLPKETVEVPELNGSVVVHGLLLKDRLAFFFNKEAGYGHLAKLLALTVMDAKGLPIFSEEEWEVWGAKKENFAATMKLFDVARRMSGLDAEVSEKK